MSWGERSCKWYCHENQPCNTKRKHAYGGHVGCDVDCEFYEWNGSTKPDSQPSKLLEDHEQKNNIKAIKEVLKDGVVIVFKPGTKIKISEDAHMTVCHAGEKSMIAKLPNRKFFNKDKLPPRVNIGGQLYKQELINRKKVLLTRIED